MDIILASASPRRQELLSQVGLRYRVCVSQCEEEATKTNPDEMVKELSMGKATDVALRILKGQAKDSDGELIEGDVIVVGADTLVFLEDKPMGKPADRTDAHRMLSELSGRTHEVKTGITMLAIHKGKIDHGVSFSETTKVSFFTLTETEILEYIATNEPMDKAGAYAIQGEAGKFVSRIDGDFSNVVGLPIGAVYQNLKTMKAGLQAWRPGLVL